jgi:acetate kinase
VAGTHDRRNSLHGRRPPDGFVFTAGIGENSPKIRAAVAERLARLGVSLDLAANAEGGAGISRPDSRIPLYVLPTDEELMIARHTLALLTKGSKQQRFEKAS